MLGMNHNKMTVSFEPFGKMVFENGAQIFTKTPDWVVKLFTPLKWITFGHVSIPDYISDAKVTYFKKRSEDTFSFSAQWRGKSKEREKPYEELKHNWRHVGEPLKPEENPRVVIERHLAASK
jgi:hypothetical protein